MVCVIVLAADLLYFGMQYNPFVSRKLIYPKLGVTEFLKPRLGLSRISGVDTPESNPWKGDCFPPSSAIPYGLTDVRGKDGFYPDRTRRFMVTIRRKLNVQFEASVHFDHVRSKLFSLMGMRYVLSRDEINEPGLKCVLRDGVRVYENPAAYPRAFIVHQARLINQEWVTQWILYHGRFEPDKQVILEEEPYGFPLETAAKPGSTARVAEYTPTKVVVDAEMKSPGFLILTDAYAPGWEVTVDGVPSRLLAGDLLFRCVPLRHGPHRVEFRYRPMSFMVGAFLTVLTLLGVPGVLLGFRWR
jgi:hypothetical protein